MERPEDIARHYLDRPYQREGAPHPMAAGPLAAIAAVRDLCRLSLAKSREIVEQVRAQRAVLAPPFNNATEREAHLVLFLDTRVSPPTVYSVGIYSETTPTSSFFGAYPILLASQLGPDYATAEKRLYANLARNPSMRWAYNLIKTHP